MTVSEADDLLKERVEEVRSAFDRNVAVTMAILAVLLATDSLFGHRAHTEELLDQAQASDQWAYYQAKTIRRTVYDVGAELARLTPDTQSQAGQSTARTFRDTAARYEQESKAIEDQAREYERDRDRYDLRQRLAYYLDDFHWQTGHDDLVQSETSGVSARA